MVDEDPRRSLARVREPAVAFRASPLQLEGKLIMKQINASLAVLAVVACASTVLAQERGGGFRRGGVMGLLSSTEVQAELKITDDQKAKLEALRAERGSREGLSRDERRARDEEFAKKVDETLKSILDEPQQQRLAELRLQRDGVRSLARAEVAEKLGLDQAQKDQLAKIQADDAAVERPDLRNVSQEEREKYFTESRDRREKMESAMLAVLTDAQKETFETMQGAKFTFPPRQNRGSGQ
jgi:hypothetical protein